MTVDDWAVDAPQANPIEHDVEQGTPEWLNLRLGLLTASEMRLIMTPTCKPADNDKSRAHTYELLAQRLTQFVEPNYESGDMLRGHDDERRARALYSEHYAPVREVGFITRSFGSFSVGYSPDGLIGDNGTIEAKSRRPKYQVQTVLDVARGFSVPSDYVLQIQTGLLVTGRKWCDFISYSGGLHMVVSRVHADTGMQSRILECAENFERRLAAEMATYLKTVESSGWVKTERELPSKRMDWESLEDSE